MMTLMMHDVKSLMTFPTKMYFKRSINYTYECIWELYCRVLYSSNSSNQY